MEDEPPTISRDALEEALRNASSVLESGNAGDAFSANAFHAFETSVSDYVRALALEAERCAVRQRSDVISSVDVEQASRYLAAGAQRSTVRHIGTAGGLFFGAAISNVLAITTSGHPHTGGLLATMALLVIGAVLIAWQIAREL